MRRLILIAVLIVFGVSIASGSVWWLFSAHLGPPVDQRSVDAVEFTIPSGQPLSMIAAGLEERKLIRSALAFKLLARMRGVAGRIQAGEYMLKTSLDADQLLTTLVAGNVRQHSLTLIEGWTFKQLIAAVRENTSLHHTLESIESDVVMKAIGREGEHPEGRFYPDTYRFPRGLTDVAFMQKAYRIMQERLESEWAQRDEGLPFKTPYEALIMASIVERETALAEERSLIAGVFVRRLQKGMRLQTDPTVIYGLGDAFDGNLRRADLRKRYPLQYLYTQRSTAHTDCDARRQGDPCGTPSSGRRCALLRLPRRWQSPILRYPRRA